MCPDSTPDEQTSQVTAAGLRRAPDNLGWYGNSLEQIQPAVRGLCERAASALEARDRELAEARATNLRWHQWSQKFGIGPKTVEDLQAEVASLRTRLEEAEASAPPPDAAWVTWEYEDEDMTEGRVIKYASAWGAFIYRDKGRREVEVGEFGSQAKGIRAARAAAEEVTE